MSVRRNRRKQVIVDHLEAVSISASATLQIGDTRTVIPYVKARAFAGERGAPSFTGGGYHETILHFVNHRDQDQSDMQNIFGKLQGPETKRRKVT